jgi:hypothetical protein
MNYFIPVKILLFSLILCDCNTTSEPVRDIPVTVSFDYLIKGDYAVATCNHEYIASYWPYRDSVSFHFSVREGSNLLELWLPLKKIRSYKTFQALPDRGTLISVHLNRFDFNITYKISYYIL